MNSMNEKENKTTNSTTHAALGLCVIGIIGLAFWFVWTIAMGGWILAILCSVVFALLVYWGIMLVGSEIGCFALLGGIILAVLAFLLALGAFFATIEIVVKFIGG